MVCEKTKESKETLVAKKKGLIVQDHHEIYSDGEHPKEVLMVRLRKGEHRIVVMLKRWCGKNVSIQFIHWLRYTADRLEMDRTISKLDLDRGKK